MRRDRKGAKVRDRRRAASGACSALRLFRIWRLPNVPSCVEKIESQQTSERQAGTGAVHRWQIRVDQRLAEHQRYAADLRRPPGSVRWAIGGRARRLPQVRLPRGGRQGGGVLSQPSAPAAPSMVLLSTNAEGRAAAVHAVRQRLSCAVSIRLSFRRQGSHREERLSASTEHRASLSRLLSESRTEHDSRIQTGCVLGGCGGGRLDECGQICAILAAGRKTEHGGKDP
mmetsp:Transcript_22593/g.36128  ORF Transcript_22593/g.36128 Transcript_22593/m.36128 type:complete len:228 (+) Transcript_22593:459-1142(+)